MQVSCAQFSGKNFAVKVSATSDDRICELTISNRGKAIARYKFEGELVSAYWSPSGDYVVINNHNGHVGWYPWFISLQDGAIIRANGEIHSVSYDRYTDYDYLPKLIEIGKKELHQIYPGFTSDTLREGYITVAYGWKDRNEVMMFHEFPFGKLFERDKAELWMTTLFRISRSGLVAHDISAKKMGGEWWKKYPLDVSRTFNMQGTSQ